MLWTGADSLPGPLGCPTPPRRSPEVPRRSAIRDSDPSSCLLKQSKASCPVSARAAPPTNPSRPVPDPLHTASDGYAPSRCPWSSTSTRLSESLPSLRRSLVSSRPRPLRLSGPRASTRRATSSGASPSPATGEAEARAHVRILRDSSPKNASALARLRPPASHPWASGLHSSAPSNARPRARPPQISHRPRPQPARATL